MAYEHWRDIVNVQNISTKFNESFNFHNLKKNTLKCCHISFLNLITLICSETSLPAFGHDESKQMIYQHLNYLSISLSESMWQHSHKAQCIPCHSIYAYRHSTFQVPIASMKTRKTVYSHLNFSRTWGQPFYLIDYTLCAWQDLSLMDSTVSYGQHLRTSYG